MGPLASSTIVETRIAIEALIYASFVLIIPLTFLPDGFKFMSSWTWLVVWIQTWPPFFAIINYIMLVTAQSKAEAFFGKAGIAAQKGLSFFTNVGIQNIQDQVFAMGDFLATSVPFITYTFLKEGLHSIGSLASSVMSPISEAASIAEGRVSKSSGDNFNEDKSAAQDLANSKEFRESYQKVENFVKNQGSSYLTDEAQRTAYDYSRSCDIVKSSQEAYRSSLNTTNQLSDNISCLEQASQHVRYNQTQEFANWLASTEKMSYSEFNSITSSGSASDRVKLLNHYADFNRERHSSLLNKDSIQGYQSPSNTYQNALNTMSKVSHNTERENIVDAFSNMNSSVNLRHGEAKSKREYLSHQHKSLENQVEKKQAVHEININSSLYKMKTCVAEEANKFVITRALKHKVDDASNTLLGLEPYEKNSFSIKERPFWHKGYN